MNLIHRKSVGKEFKLQMLAMEADYDIFPMSYTETETVPVEWLEDPTASSELTLFDILIGMWVPGIICVFGIIGNVLCLWVLSRDINRSTTFTSLKALAVSDLILLVGALLQQIVPLFCEMFARLNPFCLSHAAYLRVYSWPVVCIAQMASIWLTVVISAERFVAICEPLRIAKTGKRRRIRILIGVISVCSILYNVPRFFEFVPVEETRDNITRVVLGENEIRQNDMYRYLYNTALYCLVIYAFPLTILTYLNVRLVLTLKRARANWTKLNTNQKKEMKATKLPLVIVLVFFICGTESFVAFLLDAIFVDSHHPWLQFYTAIVNVLVIFNSAVNFLLMFFVGKRFRRLLSDAIHCRPTRRPGLIVRNRFGNGMLLSKRSLSGDSTSTIRGRCRLTSARY